MLRLDGSCRRRGNGGEKRKEIGKGVIRGLLGSDVRDYPGLEAFDRAVRNDKGYSSFQTIVKGI